MAAHLLLLRRRRTAQNLLFSRIRNMAGSKPTIPSHRARYANAGEILDSRSDFMLPTVAPGPTAGALRFVSLALHILPHKGERRRRNVSARKVSEPYHTSIRKRISLKLKCRSAHTTAKTDSAQQAWMNSRNLTTIASVAKHRQLVFSHPTLAAADLPNDAIFAASLADSGSSLYTTNFPVHLKVLSLFLF